MYTHVARAPVTMKSAITAGITKVVVVYDRPYHSHNPQKQRQKPISIDPDQELAWMSPAAFRRPLSPTTFGSSRV